MKLQDIQFHFDVGFDLSNHFIDKVTFAIGCPNIDKPMRTVDIPMPNLSRPHPDLLSAEALPYFASCLPLVKVLNRHRQMLQDVLYCQTPSADPEIVKVLNNIYSGTLATRFDNLYNFPLFPEENQHGPRT